MHLMSRYLAPRLMLQNKTKNIRPLSLHRKPVGAERAKEEVVEDCRCAVNHEEGQEAVQDGFEFFESHGGWFPEMAMVVLVELTELVEGLALLARELEYFYESVTIGPASRVRERAACLHNKQGSLCANHGRIYAQQRNISTVFKA
jgi:hypothetical protein